MRDLVQVSREDSGRGPIWKHPARFILRGKAVHVESFNTAGPAGSEILAAP